MKKFLMIMMLSCICLAVANIDRHKQTNVDELARGQPIVGTVAEIVSVPMPGIIETYHKERDVDSWCATAIYYNKTVKSTIAKSKTAPEYDDRVGWRCRS